MSLRDRTKHRLRIAAGLLRSQGHVFDVSRNQFYSAIQTFIEAMAPAERDKLRDLTDWVEEYDNASKTEEKEDL